MKHGLTFFAKLPHPHTVPRCYGCVIELHTNANHTPSESVMK